MNPGRPLVLAVSNSDQHRETLSILLDRDFEVASVQRLEATERRGATRPEAVVLSPAPWTEHLPRFAASTFPHTPLVLLDPPAGVRAAFPGALVATWSNPVSVRVAVGRAASSRREAASDFSIETCAAVVDGLEQELRRPLRVARVLAGLAQASNQASSASLAMRFLAEQAALLTWRLGWLCSAGDVERGQIDLVAAFDAALARGQLRFACRGIGLRWQERQPLPVTDSMLAHVAAAGIVGHLLNLPAAEVVLSSAATQLHCSHPDLSPSRPSLGLMVAERALVHLGAAFTLHSGRIEVLVG